MKSTIILTMAACLLSGCAQTLIYAKAGASQEDRERAIAGCKVQAAMVADKMDGWWGVALMEKTRDNCMRAQGFVREG